MNHRRRPAVPTCRLQGATLAMPDIFQTFCDARTLEEGVRGLFEDEVSHRGFEIPVENGEGSQVEPSVREHGNPDPARGGEDRSEHEPGDRGLFDAGDPLFRVVGHCKQPGREQNDPCLGAHTPDANSLPNLSNRNPRNTVSSPNPPPAIMRYTAPGSAAGLPVR